MNVIEFPAAGIGARIRANWINILLVALAFSPLLWNFFVLSWSRPAYQFFPMAMIASGMLAWRAAEYLGLSVMPGKLGVTRILAVSTCLMFVLANVLWSPWLGYIAFLMGLATIAWGLGGKPFLMALLPAGLMLMAILPPPMGLDEKLTLSLRTMAVRISCALLDWLQIIQVQDGNTVQLPGKSLFVEEACSGINSFILCNVFCLFWTLWQRRPPWWLLIAIPATSLFVVLGNILRITICAEAYYKWQVDLLSGWHHETFGLVLLFGYCGLVLSTDQLLCFLFQPADAPASPQKSPAPVAEPSLSRVQPIPVFGFKFAGAILVLLVAGILAGHILRGGRHGFDPLPKFVTTQEFTLSLPPKLAGWESLHSDSDAGSDNLNLLQTIGVHSKSWSFHRGGMLATVAVDYPFGDFHDVKKCYLQNGWHVAAEENLILPQINEDPHAIKLVLDQTFMHAVVFHAIMNERGEWVSKPQGADNHIDDAVGTTYYRIQLITGGYSPVTGANMAAAQELYFQARVLLAKQMNDQLRKTATK